MKQRCTFTLDQDLMRKARLAVREGWYPSLIFAVEAGVQCMVFRAERDRGHAYRPRHIKLHQGRKQGIMTNPFRLDPYEQLNKDIDKMLAEVRAKPMATRTTEQPAPTLWQKITHLFKGATS